jgi:hypothetical protein
LAPILTKAFLLVSASEAISHASEKAAEAFPVILVPINAGAELFHSIPLVRSLIAWPIFHNHLTVLLYAIFTSAVAITVTLHHHHVAHRLARHQIFLGALRTMAAEGTALALSTSKTTQQELFDKTNEVIRGALRALTTCLITDPKSFAPHPSARQTRFPVLFPVSDPVTPRLVATILEQMPDGEFQPRNDCQWPNEKLYSFPSDGLSNHSAAGTALNWRNKPEVIKLSSGIEEPKLPPGVVPLVYIPRTTASHGAKIWREGDELTFDLEERVFVPLALQNPAFVPKSTICFSIPLHQKYVLCLDSDQNNQFSSMDFEAVLLVAHVIGTVLKALDSPVAESTPHSKAAGSQQ